MFWITFLVVSVSVMSGLLVLLCYFYSEVRDFLREVGECCFPGRTGLEALHQAERDGAAASGRHVRINSCPEVFEGGQLPYAEDWSERWTTESRPPSTATRSLVTNVFTRTRVEYRNQMALNYHSLVNASASGSPQLPATEPGEVVVMPSMAAVNVDPVVLSRGYHIVEGAGRAVGAAVAAEAAGGGGGALLSAAVGSTSRTDPATAQWDCSQRKEQPEEGPLAKRSSSSFLSVIQDIDLVLEGTKAEFLASLGLPQSPEDGVPLQCVSQDISHLTATSVDSEAASVISRELRPCSVEAVAVAPMALLLSPTKRIRYTAGASGAFSPAGEKAASTDASSVSLLSPVSRPVPAAPVNEKMLQDETLMGQCQRIHSLAPKTVDCYGGTIYDHL